MILICMFPVITCTMLSGYLFIRQIPLTIMGLIPVPVSLFQKKAKGQDLFDQIMYHLDLVEADYFGLQFMDSEQISVSAVFLRHVTRQLLV